MFFDCKTIIHSKIPFLIYFSHNVFLCTDYSSAWGNFQHSDQDLLIVGVCPHLIFRDWAISLPLALQHQIQEYQSCWVPTISPYKLGFLEFNTLEEWHIGPFLPGGHLFTYAEPHRGSGQKCCRAGGHKSQEGQAWWPCEIIPGMCNVPGPPGAPQKLDRYHGNQVVLSRGVKEPAVG